MKLDTFPISRLGGVLQGVDHNLTWNEGQHLVPVPGALISVFREQACPGACPLQHYWPAGVLR